MNFSVKLPDFRRSLVACGTASSRQCGLEIESDPQPSSGTCLLMGLTAPPPHPAALNGSAHGSAFRFLRYLTSFHAPGPPPTTPPSPQSLLPHLLPDVAKPTYFCKVSPRGTSSIKPPSLLPSTDQAFSELSCVSTSKTHINTEFYLLARISFF